MTFRLGTAFLIAATCATASAATAECTAEEMQKKATDLTMAVQQLAATDPSRMQELTLKMQDVSTKLAQGGTADEVCAAYDEILADLN